MDSPIEGRCVASRWLRAALLAALFVSASAARATPQAALATPSAALADAPARAADAPLRTFDACLRLLRGTPYMRTRDDLDWESIAREWRPRAGAAGPGAELQSVLNAMLGEIGASHAAVLSGPVYRTMMNELSGRPSPTYGVLLEEMLPGRLFVRMLFEQGPGEAAGLRLGDEIVAVDGTAPLRSAWVIDAGYDPGAGKERLFTLLAQEEGQRIALHARRREHERPRALELQAESTSGLDAGRRSVRVVRAGATRVGVVHLWMVARGSAQLLHDALRGELRDCDALVVDLRGRGGLADEIDGLLAPFRRRAGRRVRRDDGAAARWDKPVAFLIDDRTRSAKEILAWHVRDEGLGLLIGERTEGAVLGAGFFPLPGGLWLEAPLMEVPVGEGISLEGVGVEPLEPVARAGPFAQGVDPLLRHALRRLAGAGLVAGRRRGPY